VGNHMKFCGCGMCRRGLHRGQFGDVTARKAIRKFRRMTKDALRKGDEPPKAISVPYTD
jgi:hypothetical protein